MIINPLESHRFMAARTLRDRKTDTLDAINLRMMIRTGIDRPFIETDESLAQLKGMAAFINMTDPIKGRAFLDRIAALEAKNNS